MARAFSRPALPRGSRRLQKYPGISGARARTPARALRYEPPRGRDLHLGRAAAGTASRQRRGINRARAHLGDRSASAVNASVWLRLGRVSNLPTVWSNVIAALALSGALGSASGALSLTLQLAAIFSAFYVGG